MPCCDGSCYFSLLCVVLFPWALCGAVLFVVVLCCAVLCCPCCALLLFAWWLCVVLCRGGLLVVACCLGLCGLLFCLLVHRVLSPCLSLSRVVWCTIVLSLTFSSFVLFLKQNNTIFCFKN